MTSSEILKLLQSYVPANSDIIHTSNLCNIAFDIAEKVNAEVNAAHNKGVITGLAKSAILNNNYKFN